MLRYSKAVSKAARMVEIGVGRNPNQSAIAVSFQSLAAGTGGVPLWTPIHTLDLGEAAVLPVSNVIPWPFSLPDQVGAVQAILAAAAQPLGPHDIARNFKGKRAATVRPVLDALASLGMARRLNDGRYAA